KMKEFREIYIRTDSISHLMNELSDFMSNFESRDIYSQNPNIVKMILERNDMFVNSYSIIDSDLFNMSLSDNHEFEVNDFYSMSDGYVFNIKLQKKDNEHNVIIISGLMELEISEEYRYVIIFPCVNKIRYVKT